jgi:hypothetical protein
MKKILSLIILLICSIGLLNAQEDFIVVSDSSVLPLIRQSVKKPIAFVIPVDGTAFSIWRYVPTSSSSLGDNVVATFTGTGRWLKVEYTGNIRSLSATINEVFSDKVELTYDGRTHPANRAAPISLIREKAPLVANDLTDLLAVNVLGGEEFGFSQYAHVETGTYKGQWLFCPLMTDADNGTTIRRPTNIASDASPGRWIRVSKDFTGSKTYDPANMTASGGTTSTTVTVTGAVLGQPAKAGLTTLTTQAIIVSAHVSAADTVTVVLFNPTGSSVDLGSGTLTAVVEAP